MSFIIIFCTLSFPIQMIAKFRRSLTAHAAADVDCISLSSKQMIFEAYDFV